MPTSHVIARRIGKRMKERRLSGKVGDTQQSVANAAGISVSFLSMIERGERLPTVDTLYRIARALKLRPGELLD